MQNWGKSMEINRIYCADNVDFMKENISSNLSPPYDNLRAYNGYSWDFESYTG